MPGWAQINFPGWVGGWLGGIGNKANLSPVKLELGLGLSLAKETVCKSVIWFTSYKNSYDTGEFRRFFRNALSMDYQLLMNR